MATVLIGFMGAGKTTRARELDEHALDTDALIVERTGRGIAELFAEGEERFRELEEEVVLEALGRGEVVALGGGSVLSARVREALAGHTVVWLEVDHETAWQRVRDSGRPLATNEIAFRERWAERKALYESLADVFVASGAPLQRGWLDARGPGLKLIVPARGGPVFLGPGALGVEIGAGRRFAISDANVADLHGGALPALAGLVEIPAGEEHKTLATAERVWRSLADMDVTRADTIVALGGGVVGDLAGFCAACYQRGVPVVQAPTTVVAQVDSAYGGKTGVDLPEAKNYVGAYHQPAAVLADTATLATLPVEEHAAGYAEVVKTALIAGGGFWERVAAGAPVDEHVILACARTKLAVVAADERDGGVRQVLNLGHTVGHAIETVTGYARFRHGEAVGLGLLAALRLSGQDGLRDTVRGLLAEAGLPTAFPEIDAEAVVAATARDKKRVGDEVPYVLVGEPGDVVFGQRVAADDVRAAVAELRS